MITVFMKWYGEPMDNLKVKIPKTLPSYTKDSEIERLFNAIENKRSHKGCIVRDRLLVALALKTGLILIIICMEVSMIRAFLESRK